MKEKSIFNVLRNQIDTIDEEIIYLLSRRFECVKQIGNIKKEMWIPALQTDRWDKLLQNLYDEADDKWINKELVKNIWLLIHAEALRIEK